MRVAAVSPLRFAVLMVAQRRCLSRHRLCRRSGGGFASRRAQDHIGAFVCPILLAGCSAFSNSPFFAFVGAAMNPLIAAFGCATCHSAVAA